MEYERNGNKYMYCKLNENIDIDVHKIIKLKEIKVKGIKSKLEKIYAK